MPFNVGNRVRCIYEVDFNDRVMGQLGTIRYIEGEIIGVEFDENIGGHEGIHGGMPYGYGWDCREEDLELVAPSITASAPAKARTIGEFFKRLEVAHR